MWVWWLGGITIVCFGLGAMFGAPYLPILNRERDKVLAELDLKPGQTLIDLGSGDGILLLAAARQGVRAVGYEINPLLCAISWLRTRRYRSLVSVHWGDYWRVEWPPADVVYVFLITRFMAKAERQFARRLTTKTLVASYGFALPTLKPDKVVGALHLYRYPRSTAPGLPK